jgi:Protein of unknown function (DUF1236)
MTNRFLISVAALALIAGTGFANAQGTGGRESGGAQMQSAPSSAGGAATENRESSKGASGMKAEKSPAAGQNQRAEEKENMPGQKSKSMSSENEPKGGQKNMKAEGREDRNANKAAETKQPGRETEKNAQTQGRENERNAQTQGRETEKNAQTQGRETEKNAQTQGAKENMNAQTRTESNTTVGQAGGAAKLSSDQRTKITTIIRNEHVQAVNNVDFAISVGTRVPHERISLRPLPTEVITVYPEWRGYEFFLVHDEIIVVDPNTYEIVAVLNA